MSLISGASQVGAELGKAPGSDIKSAKEFIENGVVGGGMLPKLNNCIDAIEHGVSRVHILDGRIPHCLLLEIFTNKGVGTAILSEGSEKFFYTNI